jgi:hypothetical protein
MSQAFPPLGQEFEPFLFAIVCNEGNGMPLTLISAIARSGADPWKEAARIGKLPRNIALDVLVRMVPDRHGAESTAIAARLFALLPVARKNIIIPAVASGIVVPRWSPAVPIIIALLLGLALVSIFRTPERVDAGSVRTPPTPVSDNARP